MLIAEACVPVGDVKKMSDEYKMSEPLTNHRTIHSKMTDTNEKKWREEFEALQFKYKNNLERSWNGYADGEIHSRWIMYEAARKKAQEEIDFKDSQLKTREAVLNKEIERLHKKVTSLHGGYDEAVIIFNGECEKRDKLLEQSYLTMKYFACVSDEIIERKHAEQWLKDYEELKR